MKKCIGDHHLYYLHFLIKIKTKIRISQYFFNLLVFFLYFFLFPIFLPNQIQMYTRLKDLWWFCGIREPSSNGSFLKNILYNSSQIKLRNKFIFSSSGNKKKFQCIPVRFASEKAQLALKIDHKSIFSCLVALWKYVAPLSQTIAETKYYFG